ncbi:MAG: hypothetical protein GKR89_37690 [Candidatus Latescibacteria bacterium]|nr:hypothetical protein [Candidatus Latescibacterota bacterium]
MAKLSALTTLALTACLALSACGPDEDEVIIASLQNDLTTASAVIDSLNYAVDSSNQLIDQLRARADSLQRVDERLMESVKILNKEVKEYRYLAEQRRRKNDELQSAIDQLQQEKRADKQNIAQLRSESDSLNTALLDAHTDLRRKNDHIQRIEGDLGQAQEEIAGLRQAQVSVRLYMGSEDFLKESGLLKTGRGLSLRKSYQLVKKPMVDDPRIQLVPIGQPLTLEATPEELVDRFGKLKKGRDYQIDKSNGLVTITFVNEILGGVDILGVVKN